MDSLPGAPGAPVLNAARAAASRRNGARSCGPKTPEGKARSARNALKHGLRAEKFVLLHDEDAGAFQALTDALADDLAPGPVGERGPNPLPALAPMGALQSLLARRLAIAAWRLERADRIESELFALHAERSEGGRGRLGLALVRDGNGPHAFDTLLRYRGSAMAELWRALRALKALQAQAAPDHERDDAPDEAREAEAARQADAESEVVAPEPTAPPQDGQPIEPEAGGNPREIAPVPPADEPHAPAQADAEPGEGQAAPAGHVPCAHACIQARKTTQECATMRHLCATHAPPSAGRA